MNRKEHIQLIKKYNQATSKISNEARIKTCFHPNKLACKNEIKSAHSLQRQGALKTLEKEVSGNSFLYSFTDRVHNVDANFLDLKPIGRKAASTFFGFCDFHDSSVFSSIENEPESTNIDSDVHCFLHSYRSFAHSCHRKHEQLQLYNSKDTEIIDLLNKLYGTKLEDMKKGVEIAISDLQTPKNI
jgi:hypothetical protein